MISDTQVIYFRGDSYAKEFTITDETTGDPINITGYTMTMSVDSLKTPPDASTELFTITGTIINALDGVVSFTPSSTNNDVQESRYYYKIRMSSGSTIRTAIRDKYVII